MKRLRDLGNTVVVVEHDLDTIRAADAVIDLGPGAGAQGGEVVCAGTPLDIERCRQSLTGQYLAGTKDIPVPDRRGDGNGKTLHIFGARENNLRNIDVKIPLGVFTCVTGVSDSGKSSLIDEILYRALARDLNGAYTQPGLYRRIDGKKQLDKVIEIDQQPIVSGKNIPVPRRPEERVAPTQQEAVPKVRLRKGGVVPRRIVEGVKHHQVAPIVDTVDEAPVTTVHPARLQDLRDSPPHS